MGQHTLRRASGISTTTGRAIFTGIAALGLVSGGAGMAFAGEASTYSSDHDVKGDHDDADDHDGDHDSDDDGHEKHHHGKKHHDKHDKHDETPEACEIPVVADAETATDALVNDLTDDATKPANDAAAAAAKPVDDAICHVLSPELYDLDEELGHGPKDDYRYHGESPSGLEDPATH